MAASAQARDDGDGGLRHAVGEVPRHGGAAPVMMKLFAMDGLLVAANFWDAKQHVDLWFLAD